MEHRYSPRLHADLKVLIYLRSLPVAIGRLRNLSRGGLFIASDYGNIAHNQPVEIEFLGVGSSADAHRRCRAMVAHTAFNGFGLAVDDSCPVSCDLLESLTRGHPQKRLPLNRPTARAISASSVSPSSPSTVAIAG